MSHRTDVVWVVVEVQSGLPVVVEAYRNKSDAQIREGFLRADINPNNDETDIFEVQIS
ncbi:hypothetical protein GF359_08930 [candidate division WOR-3 bacterium]|uniref:Uncharacterized protein n=1 Tax=candidate division WOR-3 bacterium TaxID=2052148 RepID=A0A9D5QD36_UNCW3|nr:hypothetical protein [candidate division WOR-3 bacterium]MBD3365323.1 hypothetical protein [candidate division WOR-3 bacterium]